MPTTQEETSSGKPSYSSQYSRSSYPTLPVQPNSGQGSGPAFPNTVNPPRTNDEARTSLATASTKYPSSSTRTIGAGSPYYYMDMRSPYPESSSCPPARSQSYSQSLPSSQMESQSSAYTFPVSSATADQHANAGQMVSRGSDLHSSMSSNAGGMMIESHDVDMNSLQQQESFPFSSGEILPWLEYLPQDVLSFFGENQNFALMSPDDETPRPPP